MVRHTSETKKAKTMDYRNKVIQLVNNGNKIAIIKYMRELTTPQMSLKDAKAAIERCQEGSYDTVAKKHYFDIDKVLALFDEITGNGLTMKMDRAMQFANENWELMGFENPAEFCRIVAHNYVRLFMEKKN